MKQRMKHTNNSPRLLMNAGISMLLFIMLLFGTMPTSVSARASSQAAEPSFRDDFDSSVLNPAWQVVSYTGTRIYGYTSPANHMSLTDQAGYLRYYLDPMTHSDGFLNNYQTTSPYYTYDPGLELLHPFSGEHWVFETKVSYYMPPTNGRGLNTRIYFGDGGANTYFVEFVRGRDVNANVVVAQLSHKSGPALSDVTQLETVTISSAPVVEVYYYRLERAGGVLTAFWSADGATWNQIFNHDLGNSLNGLEQRVALAGYSWFNNAGSYADYDYVSVTDTSSPTTSLTAAVQSTGEVYPGDPLPVNLNIQSADGLYAAQALCEVNPSVLQLQSGEFGDFFDPTLRLVAANQADAAAGKWLGAISQQNPAAPLSGDGLYAAINYVASAPGTTSLNCEPLFSDRDGFSLPVSFTGADITVLPFGIVNGEAHYQGRLDQAGIEVTATGPVTQTVYTDASGNLALNQLKTGNYNIKADAALYLPACFNNVAATSGQTVTLATVTLLGGDLNDDESIIIGDLTRLGAGFGTSDSGADINVDGTVNVQDLALIGGNYGISGCQAQ